MGKEERLREEKEIRREEDGKKGKGKGRGQGRGEGRVEPGKEWKWRGGMEGVDEEREW